MGGVQVHAEGTGLRETRARLQNPACASRAMEMLHKEMESAKPRGAEVLRQTGSVHPVPKQTRVMAAYWTEEQPAAFTGQSRINV